MTKFDMVVEYIAFAIIVTLSFVLLMPFHMAAGSFGGIAPTVMLLINLAFMVFGYLALWRRWPRFMRDLKGEEEKTTSRVPKVGRTGLTVGKERSVQALPIKAAASAALFIRSGSAVTGPKSNA